MSLAVDTDTDIDDDTDDDVASLRLCVSESLLVVFILM